MIANFFIQRPIAAIVSALLLVLIGVISIIVLPTALYPDISPPNITISGSYVGANAKTIEETVLIPIENALSGIPNMMYVQSNATAYGVFAINITLEIGSDTNEALVEVKNRLSQAESVLPEEVKKAGILTEKVSPTILKYILFYSPNKTHDISFISNYIRLFIQTEIAKLPGVGKADINAYPFAMRIWLDPNKMAQLKIAPQDVSTAIYEQNAQIAAGVIGRPPIKNDQVFEYSISVESKLKTAEEFEKIIVGDNPETGAMVFLKDIARVELGQEGYDSRKSINGYEGAALGVLPSVGANSLAVGRLVEEKLKELSLNFPSDFTYMVPWDTTVFVKASLKEVIYIFLEALLLVILVVFIFLQSWRATLIALMAIPVSIIGTFPFFIALGFSINSITLFGMILAIGIVVDDAIIVVEAVQHHIDVDKLSPKEATYKAMKEISSPVIATAFILAAVFVPVAFIPGITGGLFKQFAITISISVLISAFVALSLTPALSALMMRGNPVQANSKGLYGLFFKFNIWLDRQTGRYQNIIKKSLGHLKITLFILLLLYVATVILSKSTSTTFLPKDNTGAIFVSVTMPPNTASGKTIEALDQIEAILLQHPNMKTAVYFSHLNLLLGGVNLSNSGTFFLTPKDFKTNEAEFTKELQQQLSGIPNAEILVLAFPPIDGLGNTDGFSMVLKQQQGSLEELEQTSKRFIARLQERPEIAYAFSSFSASIPNINLKIDKNKARQLGVGMQDINNALQMFLGGFYVNDFNIYNRNFRVFIQSEGEYREKIEQLSAFHVRNKKGEMIPMSNLVSYDFGGSAEVINHFNLKRSVEINGAPAAGYSSGDALQALKELGETELSSNYSFEFANMSLQESRAGDTSTFILLLSLIFVFLFLAAFYESWTIPFAVLAAVPLGIFGAFFALHFAGYENSVYAQIGLVTLIGLSVKTSILIVEFCKERQEHGVPLIEAAIQAATLRLRPILMTGLAFIFGVVALITATGAGAGSKNNLGWTVFGGMMAIVFISIFFVPALYVWITKMSKKS
jgi:HAE1 family hydrophobic/amphiphilic exporter-1